MYTLRLVSTEVTNTEDRDATDGLFRPYCGDRIQLTAMVSHYFTAVWNRKPIFCARVVASLTRALMPGSYGHGIPGWTGQLVICAGDLGRLE